MSKVVGQRLKISANINQGGSQALGREGSPLIVIVCQIIKSKLQLVAFKNI